jgi:hypothetical protein
MISKAAERKKFLALKTWQDEKSVLVSCGQNRTPMKLYGNNRYITSYDKKEGNGWNPFASRNVTR